MIKNKKGFTLIELLIVIGIIAILAGIVLVAVNPAQQFGKANDSERKSEIGMILSAFYQYQTSPSARGELPSCLIDTVATAIPDCGEITGETAFDGAIQLGTGTGNYNCSGTALLVPNYLREVPYDPASAYDAENTGYYVCQTDPGAPTSTVYVLAPYAEVYTEAGCSMDLGGVELHTAMCVSG
jgi:prepilin-type N-terminal cleavage/methylation domain-containing protein